MASYFLTVSPDDDNSYVVQGLSRVEVDNDIQVKDLSDVELTDRAKE